MFKNKIKRLINDYGVKQQVIIDLIKSNRNSFSKKLDQNDFTENEKRLINDKYGSLIS